MRQRKVEIDKNEKQSKVKTPWQNIRKDKSRVKVKHRGRIYVRIKAEQR
jgi:hypothetical protein